MTHKWVTPHLGDMPNGPLVGHFARKTTPQESMPQRMLSGMVMH